MQGNAFHPRRFLNTPLQISGFLRQERGAIERRVMQAGLPLLLRMRWYTKIFGEAAQIRSSKSACDTMPCEVRSISFSRPQNRTIFSGSAEPSPV
jgi:hypothetical protein